MDKKPIQLSRILVDWWITSEYGIYPSCTKDFYDRLYKSFKSKIKSNKT